MLLAQAFKPARQRTPSDCARCAQPNKVGLIICLVFTLDTVTLVEPLLVTATRVPEAFQLAEREADVLKTG